MDTQNLTFDKLPEAVQSLLYRLEKIESLLTKGTEASEDDVPLTVHQAASVLNLSVPTIYAKVNKREIPYMKRGGRLYFSKKELLNYLNEGRVCTASELKDETIKSLGHG